MSGNTFGQQFTITSFGESHGPAIGCVVDGCPAGLELSAEDIQPDLDRRKPGQSKFTTQRRETDQIEILSGIFEGKTTGTPIALVIRNQDAKSKDYDDLKDVFRPGHGDYTYFKKYGIRDHRGGGRASARETAARVAAGAIAKKYLAINANIEVRACVVQIGKICAEQIDWQQITNNPFNFADASKVEELEKAIQDIRKQGDSLGAKVYVEALNVPVGLGEPVFDRLDAALAAALMSINAVKAVEIGDGVACVEQTGSQHRDELTPEGFLSNHAGGILAGISSGQSITAKISLKPTSSILIPGRTIDTQANAVEVSTKGRHDPCVGIRAVPIAEAMMAITLMDHYLRMNAYENAGDRGT